MKAVTVKEENLNSEIEDCFGRAVYFYLFDEISGNYEFCLNPGNDSLSDSGSKAASFLVSKGVKTIISRNIGIKAKQLLDKSEVQIVIAPLKYRFLAQITGLLKKSG